MVTTRIYTHNVVFVQIAFYILSHIFMRFFNYKFIYIVYKL